MMKVRKSRLKANFGAGGSSVNQQKPAASPSTSDSSLSSPSSPGFSSPATTTEGALTPDQCVDCTALGFPVEDCRFPGGYPARRAHTIRHIHAELDHLYADSGRNLSVNPVFRSRIFRLFPATLDFVQNRSLTPSGWKYPLGSIASDIPTGNRQSVRNSAASEERKRTSTPPTHAVEQGNLATRVVEEDLRGTDPKVVINLLIEEELGESNDHQSGNNQEDQQSSLSSLEKEESKQDDTSLPSTSRKRPLEPQEKSPSSLHHLSEVPVKLPKLTNPGRRLVALSSSSALCKLLPPLLQTPSPTPNLNNATTMPQSELRCNSFESSKELSSSSYVAIETFSSVDCSPTSGKETPNATHSEQQQNENSQENPSSPIDSNNVQSADVKEEHAQIIIEDTNEEADQREMSPPKDAEEDEGEEKEEIKKEESNSILQQPRLPTSSSSNETNLLAETTNVTLKAVLSMSNDEENPVRAPATPIPPTPSTPKPGVRSGLKIAAVGSHSLLSTPSSLPDRNQITKMMINQTSSSTSKSIISNNTPTSASGNRPTIQTATELEKRMYYFCQLCSQAVGKDSSGAMDHALSLHQDKSYVFCPVCPFSSPSSPTVVRMHIQRYHAEQLAAEPLVPLDRRREHNEEIVKIVRECFPEKKRLKLRRTKQPDERVRVECQLCHKLVSTVGGGTTFLHVATNHMDDYMIRCPICPDYAKKYSDHKFDTHVYERHPDRPDLKMIDLRPKFSPTIKAVQRICFPELMAKRKERASTYSRNTIPCSVCRKNVGDSYITKVSHVLNDHLKRKLFSCSGCSYETNVRTYIHQHLQKQHEGGDKDGAKEISHRLELSLPLSSMRLKCFPYNPNNDRRRKPGPRPRPRPSTQPFPQQHRRRLTSLSTNQAMRRHIRKQRRYEDAFERGDTSIPKVKCELCQRWVRSNLNSRQIHPLVYHSDMKLYRCSNCSMDSNTKLTMERHIERRMCVPATDQTPLTTEGVGVGETGSVPKIISQSALMADIMAELRRRCFPTMYIRPPTATKFARINGGNSSLTIRRKYQRAVPLSFDGPTMYCKLCQQTLPWTQSTRYQHTLAHHMTEDLFKCNECPFGTKFRPRAIKHGEQHMIAVDQKPTSPMSFFMDLTDVLGPKLSELRLECFGPTKRRYRRRGQLEPPQRTDQPTRIECKLCLRNVNSFFVWSHATRMHFARKLYKCNLCEFGCHERSMTRNHVRKRHPNTPADNRAWTNDTMKYRGLTRELTDLCFDRNATLDKCKELTKADIKGVTSKHYFIRLSSWTTSSDKKEEQDANNQTTEDESLKLEGSSVVYGREMSYTDQLMADDELCDETTKLETTESARINATTIGGPADEASDSALRESSISLFERLGLTTLMGSDGVKILDNEEDEEGDEDDEGEEEEEEEDGEERREEEEEEEEEEIEMDQEMEEEETADNSDQDDGHKIIGNDSDQSKNIQEKTAATAESETHLAEKEEDLEASSESEEETENEDELEGETEKEDSQKAAKPEINQQSAVVVEETLINIDEVLTEAGDDEAGQADHHRSPSDDERAVVNKAKNPEGCHQINNDKNDEEKDLSLIFDDDESQTPIVITEQPQPPTKAAADNGNETDDRNKADVKKRQGAASSTDKDEGDSSNGTIAATMAEAVDAVAKDHHISDDLKVVVTDTIAECREEEGGKSLSKSGEEKAVVTAAMDNNGQKHDVDHDDIAAVAALDIATRDEGSVIEDSSNEEEEEEEEDHRPTQHPTLECRQQQQQQQKERTPLKYEVTAEEQRGEKTPEPTEARLPEENPVEIENLEGVEEKDDDDNEEEEEEEEEEDEEEEEEDEEEEIFIFEGAEAFESEEGNSHNNKNMMNDNTMIKTEDEDEGGEMMSSSMMITNRPFTLADCTLKSSPIHRQQSDMNESTVVRNSVVTIDDSFAGAAASNKLQTFDYPPESAAVVVSTATVQQRSTATTIIDGNNKNNTYKTVLLDKTISITTKSNIMKGKDGGNGVGDGVGVGDGDGGGGGWCQICQSHLPAEKDLEFNHVIRSHLSEKLYSCSGCNWRTNDAELAERHVFDHTPCVAVGAYLMDRRKEFEGVINSMKQQCFGWSPTRMDNQQNPQILNSNNHHNSSFQHQQLEASQQQQQQQQQTTTPFSKSPLKIAVVGPFRPSNESTLALLPPSLPVHKIPPSIEKPPKIIQISKLRMNGRRSALVDRLSSNSQQQRTQPKLTINSLSSAIKPHDDPQPSKPSTSVPQQQMSSSEDGRPSSKLSSSAVATNETSNDALIKRGKGQWVIFCHLCDKDIPAVSNVKYLHPIHGHMTACMYQCSECEFVGKHARQIRIHVADLHTQGTVLCNSKKLSTERRQTTENCFKGSKVRWLSEENSGGLEGDKAEIEKDNRTQQSPSIIKSNSNVVMHKNNQENESNEAAESSPSPISSIKKPSTSFHRSCSICNKLVSASKVCQMLHAAAHSQKYGIECTHCDYKTYMALQNMKVHMKTRHGLTNPQPIDHRAKYRQDFAQWWTKCFGGHQQDQQQQQQQQQQQKQTAENSMMKADNNVDVEITTIRHSSPTPSSTPSASILSSSSNASSSSSSSSSSTIIISKEGAPQVKNNNNNNLQGVIVEEISSTATSVARLSPQTTPKTTTTTTTAPKNNSLTSLSAGSSVIVLRSNQSFVNMRRRASGQPVKRRFQDITNAQAANQSSLFNNSVVNEKSRKLWLNSYHGRNGYGHRRSIRNVGRPSSTLPPHPPVNLDQPRRTTAMSNTIAPVQQQQPLIQQPPDVINNDNDNETDADADMAVCRLCRRKESNENEAKLLHVANIHSKQYGVFCPFCPHQVRYNMQNMVNHISGNHQDKIGSQPTVAKPIDRRHEIQDYLNELVDECFD